MRQSVANTGIRRVARVRCPPVSCFRCAAKGVGNLAQALVAGRHPSILVYPARFLHTNREELIHPDDISLLEVESFADSSASQVAAALQHALSSARPPTFQEERRLDPFSRARVINFVKRYAKDRSIRNGTDVFETDSGVMSDTGTLYHSRLNIPLSYPEHTPGERSDGLWAHGLANSIKDAEILAAMHAERIIDALGYHIYTLPSMQRKHAAAARKAGRYAPSPDDGESVCSPCTEAFPLPLQRRSELDESESGSWQLVDLTKTPFASPARALISPCVLDTTVRPRIRNMFADIGLSLTQFCSVERVEPVEKDSAVFFVASITIPSELTKHAEPVVMAKGKAQKRDDALDLAAMHAELLLDALDIALFPTDSTKQKEHAIKAWGFGRPAPLPGAQPRNPSHVSPPLPLKELVVRSKGRFCALSQEETLVHRHHCLTQQCSDYTETDTFETTAVADLLAFLKSQEDPRAEYPFFHEEIHGYWKSTVVLPLPDAFGIRGGVGIAKSTADADILAAAHCLDVLTALGVSVKADAVQQAAWVQAREFALCRTVRQVGPTLPSPPGWRAAPGSSTKRVSVSVNTEATAAPAVDREEIPRDAKRRVVKRAKTPPPPTTSADPFTVSPSAATTDVVPKSAASLSCQRAQVPQDHRSLEADSPDGYIMVDPTKDEVVSQTVNEHAITSPRKIDYQSKQRVTEYLASVGRRMDGVFSTEFIDADANGGQGIHRCVGRLPVPLRFGDRVAIGEAATSADAEHLAAMHAELILDTLGVCLYSNPSKQRKHAEMCERQGRWAPTAAGQEAAAETRSPPPLRRAYMGSLHWKRQQVKRLTKPVTVNCSSPPKITVGPTADSTDTSTVPASEGAPVKAGDDPPPRPPLEEMEYTAVLEDQLDPVSKYRVQYYLRYRQASVAESYEMELGRGTILHTCSWLLPISPEHGGGEREAKGIAPTKRDAEILAWMHAERILDALQIPVFPNLPKFQAWHAQLVTSQGRSAPACLTPAVTAPCHDIHTPPPLRLTASLPLEIQRPDPPTVLTDESWQVYVDACTRYITDKTLLDHNAFFAMGRSPRTGEPMLDKALDEAEAEVMESTDQKLLLQNYCNAAKYNYPIFWKTQTVGPLLHRVSWATIPVPGHEYLIAQGVGVNRDLAQRRAALHALFILSHVDPNYTVYHARALEHQAATASGDEAEQQEDDGEFDLDTFEVPLIRQAPASPLPRKFKTVATGELTVFHSTTGELTINGKKRLLDLLAVCWGVVPPVVRQWVRYDGRSTEFSISIDFTDEEGVLWTGKGNGSTSLLGNEQKAFEDLFEQLSSNNPVMSKAQELVKQHPLLDPATIVSVSLTAQQKHGMQEIINGFREDDEEKAAVNEASSASSSVETESITRAITMEDAERAAASQELLERLQDKITTPNYIENFAVARQRLSISQRKDDILRAIEGSSVVIICGTTGCGKTTQVPQFILDHLTEQGAGGTCSILITQPRRLSAVSVSQRVAAERLEEIGESCGYTIRFDTRPGRHINFCTTGILLRMLHTNPDLVGINYLIIDEIHERDLNSDFLLIILKDLVRRRRDLRIVLMSATLQAQQFGNYFSGSPIINVEGYVFPVKELFIEDLVPFAEEKKFISPMLKEAAAMVGRLNQDSGTSLGDWLDNSSSAAADSVSVSSQYGVLEVTTEIDYAVVQFAVEHAVRTMDLSNSSILVFLPGWEEIVRAKEMLERNLTLHIIPLHSSVSPEEQLQCFLPAKEGKLKVILSTNIAESGVTIDDIGAVIDVGRAKEKSYISKLSYTSAGQGEVDNVSQLLTVFASRANCIQRRGRVGRTRPGICIRLFSRRHFEKLHEFQTPEMLRTSLDSLCLQIMSLRLGDPAVFLAKALEPPSGDRVESAMSRLQDLGALTAGRELTPLGLRLSMLPVDPKIGKMILMGAALRCLDSALTIAAITQADVFASGRENREPVRLHREDLSKNTQSDVLASVNGFNFWVTAHYQKAPAEVVYDLQERLLSVPQLLLVSRYKQQFYQILRGSDFFIFSNDDFCSRQKLHADKEDIFVDSSSLSEDAGHAGLLKCVVATGLLPNVCVYRSKRLLRTKLENNVATSADSVVHRTAQKAIQNPYFVYTELAKGTRSLVARGLTNVSVWTILLMAPNSMPITYNHDLGLTVVNGWMYFRTTYGTFQTLEKFKRAMGYHFDRKCSNPADPVNNRNMEAIREIIKDLVSTPVKPNELVGVTWVENGVILQPQVASSGKKAVSGEPGPSKGPAIEPVLDKDSSVIGES